LGREWKNSRPFCFPFVSLSFSFSFSQNLVEKPNFGKRKVFQPNFGKGNGTNFVFWERERQGNKIWLKKPNFGKGKQKGTKCGNQILRKGRLSFLPGYAKRSLDQKESTRNSPPVLRGKPSKIGAGSP
jgi:hypothetical protein